MSSGVFYHQSAWPQQPAKLTAVFLALEEVSYRMFDASDDVFYPEVDQYPYGSVLMSNAVKILLADAPTPPPEYKVTVRDVSLQVSVAEQEEMAEYENYFMTYQQRRFNVDIYTPPVIPPGPTGGSTHRRRFGSLRS